MGEAAADCRLDSELSQGHTDQMLASAAQLRKLVAVPQLQSRGGGGTYCAESLRTRVAAAALPLPAVLPLWPAQHDSQNCVVSFGSLRSNHTELQLDTNEEVRPYSPPPSLPMEGCEMEPMHHKHVLA